MILDDGIDVRATGQTVFANTANNVSGVLAVAVGTSDTTISLSPGGGALFPNAPFYISCEFEVMWCMSKSGDGLIVQRGADGTTPQAHIVGQSIEMRNNAGLWTDAYHAINNVSGDVTNLTAGILNKTALPPDTTFKDNIQELTHKTIDLTDGSKANVIVGNVQPDPSALTYTNILNNGGFDLWITAPSTTLAAGSPASGPRISLACNFWYASGVNDSAITVARDSTNPDGATPAGYNALLNFSTVQANDQVALMQPIDSSVMANMNALVGIPCSMSARIKVISGSGLTVMLGLNYVDSAGAEHGQVSAKLSLSGSGYQTYKFENQVWAQSLNPQQLKCYILFQGVGQIAVDNVMVIQSNVAATFRPKTLVPTSQPNLLVNGGCEVWQRGGGPFTSNNIFLLDRWHVDFAFGGLSTYSASRVVSSIGSSGYSVQFNYNHVAGSSIHLSQIDFSGTDWLSQIKGKTVTISARVKCNNPGLVNLFAQGSVMPLARGPGNVGGANSEERLSLTIAIPPNESYMYIGFEFMTLSGSAELNDAMLVTGSVPADYEPLHPADDLARCQRYYEIVFEGTASAQFTYYAAASNGIVFWIPLKSRKAVAPTCTKNGTWALANTAIQPTIVSGGSIDGFSFQMGTAVATGMLSMGNNAAGCNVTVEANP